MKNKSVIKNRTKKLTLADLKKNQGGAGKLPCSGEGRAKGEVPAEARDKAAKK